MRSTATISFSVSVKLQGTIGVSFNRKDTSFLALMTGDRDACSCAECVRACLRALCVCVCVCVCVTAVCVYVLGDTRAFNPIHLSLPLTHSLTHSLSPSLTLSHSLSHSHSLTHSLSTHLLTREVSSPVMPRA